MLRMFKKSAYLSSFVFLAAVFSYGYRMVVERYLGLEAYGQVGIVLSLLNIVSIVILSAIPPAIARYRAEGRGVFGPALKFGYIGIGVGLVVFLCAPILISYYELSFNLVLLMAATIPVLTYVAIGRGMLQGSGRTTLFGFTQFLEELLRFGFAFALIFWSYFVFGAVFAILLASVVTALFVLFAVRDEKSNYSFKPMLKYMVPISITRLVDGIVLFIDVILLKLWVPLSVIGMYSIAGPISRIPLYVFASIATVLLPEVAKNKKKMGKLTKEAVMVGALVLIGIGILFAFPIYFMKLLFSTAGMTAGDLAATAAALRILLISSFFMGIYKIITSSIHGMGKAKKLVPIAVSVLIVDVVLIVLLAPIYGMIGAALGTMTAAVLASIGSYVVLRRSSKVKGKA